MYYAEIDIVSEQDNAVAVQLLRREVNPLKIHVRVIELHSPSGYPFIRLRANKRPLMEWLKANGYEDEIVRNEMTPDAIPHNRK